MKRVAAALAWFEARWEGLLGAGNNPFHQLGALCIYCFWIALVTGIYLFVFYRTSIEGSWESVEQLTREQWYVGGVMRSLHRYASDAAVLFMLGHLLREFVRGRYSGARWFSWLTGVPLIWIVLWLGISGYWMVWDQLAQYVAVSTARLLDVLPIFTDPMSRNFLDNASVSDRFFTLIAFIHLIGLPLFLVLGLWFHLLRIRLPRINPPRGLMFSSLMALLLLSLAYPALSHPAADLDQVPASLRLDWFYLAVFPLQAQLGQITAWLLLTGATLLLAAMPWLWPQPRPAVAEVHLTDCVGCSFCAEDCPYGAISMVPRSDGRNIELQAEVDPAMCVGCGICVGSCPSASPYRRQEPLLSGIELPTLPMETIKQSLHNAANGSPPRILLVSCAHGATLADKVDPGLQQLALPCAGMLPPSVIDYALRAAGFDAVLIAGCAPQDCMHRYGDRWTLERIARQRPPMLRERVPRQRLAVTWNKAGEQASLLRAIADLQRQLPDSAASMEPKS